MHPVPQRLANRAAGTEGIVDDQREIVLLRQGRERLEIRHGEPRIADRFQVDRLGLRIDQGLEARHLHAIGKPRLDPDVFEGVFKLIVRAAVEVRGRDKIITHGRDIIDREKLRRVPRRSRQRRHASLERRDALFEDIVGRIHQPGVDIAELLEREKARAVCGIFKLISGRLVDRHRARTRGRINLLAGVQLQRFEIHGSG